MKNLIVLAAMAATAVLLPGKAAATTNPFLLNLNVSGAVEVQTNENYITTKTEVNVYGSRTVSFNNKYIYNLISNAVANAYGELGTNLTATNLPADGYIAFNINAYDNPYGEGPGTFYVTNKSGLFYPLSGNDAMANYYSFIELDDDDYDFYNNFEGAYVGGESDKTGNGKYTEMEPSAFYVHDNPYSYDDGDYPSEVFSNYMAIEIRCNIKATYSYTNGDYLIGTTDTSTGGGCGTAVFTNDIYTAVTAGKITLMP